MAALFNPNSFTNKLASHQLVSQKYLAVVLLLYPYLSFFKLDFDDGKSKVGLLGQYNSTS